MPDIEKLLQKKGIPYCPHLRRRHRQDRRAGIDRRPRFGDTLSYKGSTTREIGT